MATAVFMGSLMAYYKLVWAERETPGTIGCGSRSERLIVFHAGSLAVPFKQIEEEFEKIYPQVDVQLEAGGSRICARKVTELHRAADVLALADYRIIEELLMPDYADWYVRFARNQMVLAFTRRSKYAQEIDSQNWHEVLTRPGVQYGHSEPNSDPCGYRTILVWQLAEKYYGQPGLFSRLKDCCPKRNIRPRSVELIALLEAGELDYAFEYESVATQRKLRFIELPREIDLSSVEFKDFYKEAFVRLSGKEPGSWVIRRGWPIAYGLIIPKRAPNFEMAIKLVEFLLGPRGQKILAESGQPPIIPPEASEKAKLPEALRRLVR